MEFGFKLPSAKRVVTVAYLRLRNIIPTNVMHINLIFIIIIPPYRLLNTLQISSR